MTSSTAARIPALEDAELSEEQATLLERFKTPVGIPNLIRALANAPDVLEGFGAWGRHFLSERNTLPVDRRELAILRTGLLCGCAYEWAQHVRVGLLLGLTEDQIQRVKSGPEAPDWSAADRVLLQAVDELHAQQTIKDETWLALGEVTGFDQRQKMDLVFTVGHYTMVAMILKSFGVPLDEGLEADPEIS